jgi:hypothetical protein
MRVAIAPSSNLRSSVMTQSKFLIGLALIGAAAAAVWSVSTDGDGSKASAAGQASSIHAQTSGMSMHQTHGKAQMDALPVAQSADHGFVFPTPAP